jgi:hypothetical protein
MPEPHPYYDAKRPAVDGRWVAIHKGSVVITNTTHRTEAEARTAMGLDGGSTDPRYIPKGVS